MHAGEKQLHHWLRGTMLQPKDRLDRVENVVLPGMFDANYCFAGVEGWIEYKAPSEDRKRATTALFSGEHKLSKDQRNWGIAQKLAGGRCWVMVNTESRRMLFGPESFYALNEMTVYQAIQAARWHMEKGEDKARAAELREILIKGPMNVTRTIPAAWADPAPRSPF